MATEEDLQRLFLIQGESLAIEFKSWLDLSQKEGKATLAKAAIALANHGGGTIILGMREGAGAPIASTSRPQQIARYNPDAVNAAINRYADPHIHCDVVHLAHPKTGHEHAFVLVPGGHAVPIMSTKDLPGTILAQRCYIRKPGPKSEEPFTSDEWRKLINNCVQNGRDSLLEAFRLILQGQALGSVPAEAIDRLREFRDASFERWQERIAALPAEDAARFPNGFYELTFQFANVPPAEGLSVLKGRMENASQVKHSGWGPFVFLDRKPIGPVPAGDVIEAWVGDPSAPIRSGRYSDFWRAHPDGLLYQIRGYDEDHIDSEAPGTVLDFLLPIIRVGEPLLYAARLAKLFGDDPEISIVVHYGGLNGRVMKSVFDWRYLSYDRKCIIDGVTSRGAARASVIEDNTAEVLLPLLQRLYDSFDFAPLSPENVAGEISKLKQNRR